jgi:hypothetical protein
MLVSAGAAEACKVSGQSQTLFRSPEQRTALSCVVGMVRLVPSVDSRVPYSGDYLVLTGKQMLCKTEYYFN